MSTAEEIKKNAIYLISRYGFDSVSMRQLARATDIHTGSIYAHYKNKNDILNELLTDYMENLILAWHDKKKRLRDPKNLLTAFIKVYINHYYHHKEESIIISLDMRSLNEHEKEEVNRLKEIYENELIKVLEIGTIAGSFNVDDYKLTSTVLMSILSGVCSTYCHHVSYNQKLVFDRVLLLAEDLLKA